MLDDLRARHPIDAAIATLADLGGAALAARVPRGEAGDVLIGDLIARATRAGQPRRAFSLVDSWLMANGFRLPRRSGHLTPAAAAAATHLGQQLRTALLAVLADPAFAPTARDEFLLVYLWRQVFLNPYAALNLVAPPASPATPGPDELHRGLRAPFAAPARTPADIAALWARREPLALRLIHLLWLISLPEIGLDEALRDRALGNLIGACAALRAAPPPGAAFAMFVDEAMAALFRASYAGGNTCAALSALGDLIAEEMPRRIPLAPLVPRSVRTRPRVGYVSTAFRTHPVALYMSERILQHDRDRFEVVVFAVGDRHDDVTADIRGACSRMEVFPDPEDLPTIAHAIRRADLDLLIFADLGMDLPTLLLAGLSLAPRQIALMGHATSTGMPTISHYLSGDHEGPDADRHYRERLIRLPGAGAAQRAMPTVPPRPWRQELGIRDDAVVLVNLNNAIKFPPERDHVYGEILARVPDAVLVLKPFFERASWSQAFVDRIIAMATRHGVADRLFIVPPLTSGAEVGGLLAIADVHLDTYPFGGWTTNLDALAAGLPIVTREGDLGRSRWGAAFLRAMAIDTGIAATDDAYVAWAVRLASDAELRRTTRARIGAQAHDLFFNGARAQPAYEAALRAVLSASA